MKGSLRLLVVTSEWPSAEHPERVPFVVEQVEQLRRTGVSLELYPFRGRSTPWAYLRAWNDLRRRHRLRSFDLVHAHFGQAGLVALPCPVPLIVTFHGSDLLGIVGASGRYTIKGRVLRAVSRLVARRAAHSIVVAEHLRGSLPRGVDSSVVPCGVDLKRFSAISGTTARERLGLPTDRHLVLFGGDPTNPVKRHPLAASAVRQLATAVPADLVPLTGVPHDLVPVYMSACDALLMTSRHEGSPMVIKEALACGLPIVSVPVGDVEERTEGVDGCVLCDSDAPAELARSLAAVLTRKERVDGRAAVADLAHEVVTRRLLDIYRGVLA